MTAPNNLELQGSFHISPLAEVIVEIRQARLDGSLRLEREANKTVIYFKSGEIVFAVSNARAARLFEMLLRAGKIDKQTIAEHACYANDLEFAKVLREKNILTEAEFERLFSAQIENILRDALEWKTGVWTFSPLVKIRDGISFPVAPSAILAEHARRLSGEEVHRRFRSVKENFAVCAKFDDSSALQTHEAFVLSRFAEAELTVDQAIQLSSLSETVTLQTLYVLWIGGFLIRRNWNSVFTEHRVSSILSARLARKKQAADFQSAPQSAETLPKSAPKIESAAESEPDKAAAPAAVQPLSVEEYLARVEAAGNYYDVLNVEVKAATGDIKRSYFNLAKQFHPDRFYKKSENDLHKRVQDAFTQIAQAYETLKQDDSRRSYDFKIRKELAEKEKMANATATEVSQQKQIDWATESFETGFSHLMDENFDEALPFLARAVHQAPNVARFHAYYGKALSADETQRFKAESEMQTAIKLDNENATFRLLLAEFYVQYNLVKRAEGELNRLLAMFPHNRDARALLDSLRNK